MTTPGIGGSGSANFVIRFISDLSAYNPARKVEAENRRIASSNRDVAAAAVASSRQAQAAYQRNQALAGLGALPPSTVNAIAGAAQAGALSGPNITALNELARRRALHTGSIETIASAAQSGILSSSQVSSIISGAQQGRFNAVDIANARNALNAQQQAQRQAQAPLASEGGRFWQDPGRHSTRRIGAITALPAGPSAIAGTAFGRTAGALADIGVVGGLLPEGLSAGAAVGGLAAIGGAIALTKLTQATISASRSMGTVASIKLDAAMASLKRQTTLLFAAIGDSLLPIITAMVKGLTRVVRWLNLWVPENQDQTGTGSIIIAGRDTRGNVVASDRSNAHRMSAGSEQFRTAAQQAVAEHSGNIVQRWWAGMRAGGWLSALAEGAAPGMAAGGIIRPTPGGTLTRVAERGESEAIMPLRYISELFAAQGRQSMAASVANTKAMADAFLSSLDQSQELPPLWTAGDDPADVNIVGGGVSGGGIGVATPPLTFISRAAYTALADKSGNYAVF